GADVTFVDSSRDSGAAIRANVAELGFGARATMLGSEVRRALAALGAAHESFDLIFVDAPFKDDMSAEVLQLLCRYGLAASNGWMVVEQSKRAPAAPDAPAGFERVTVARLGDHRLAFYRREETPPRNS
ncbi:MAG TPA: RsmD family RNA methyltransferase, partial [Candidatus Acidoferrales bacterium]|nr:RsmD family RNA methyltransferase [Candidatus Acidoferrales bacterium]